LLVACCLLPVAYCLLLVACCLLLVACCHRAPQRRAAMSLCMGLCAVDQCYHCVAVVCVRLQWGWLCA
jgi:hypothetical protein